MSVAYVHTKLKREINFETFSLFFPYICFDKSTIYTYVFLIFSTLLNSRGSLMAMSSEKFRENQITFISGGELMNWVKSDALLI